MCFYNEYGFMSVLWLSILATVCSTTASIPQLVHNNQAISRKTIAIRCLGCVLWTAYGALRLEYVLCVCSAIAACVEVTLYVKTFLCRRGPDDIVPSPVNDATAQSSGDTCRVEQSPRSDSASSVHTLTLHLEGAPSSMQDS